MLKNYLFPNKYKIFGWCLFVPSLIIGILAVGYDWTPSILDIHIPDMFQKVNSSPSNSIINFGDENLLNEIIGLVIIIGGLLAAFSKEKIEDEYIMSIRLQSLLSAVFVNYGVLAISLFLFYGTDFLWVLMFNMYTILIIYIIIFNWKLRKAI